MENADNGKGNRKWQYDKNGAVKKHIQQNNYTIIPKRAVLVCRLICSWTQKGSVGVSG